MDLLYKLEYVYIYIRDIDIYEYLIFFLLY